MQGLFLFKICWKAYILNFLTHNIIAGSIELTLEVNIRALHHHIRELRAEILKEIIPHIEQRQMGNIRQMIPGQIV